MMPAPVDRGGRRPTHGGYAGHNRIVSDPRTAELRRGFVDLLVEEAGGDINGAEAAAIGIAADALVRLTDLNAWLDGRDIIDAAGEPLPAMKLYIALTNASGRAVERVATLAAMRRNRKPGGLSLAEYLEARTSDAPEPASAPTDTAPDSTDAPDAAPASEPLSASAAPSVSAGAPTGCAHASQPVDSHGHTDVSVSHPEGGRE